MSAHPEWHRLIRPCTHCPHPDLCTREQSCRATWDTTTRHTTTTTERAHAEQHTCPACEAPPGHPCHNLRTGKPLTRQPAHQARIHNPEATR